MLRGYKAVPAKREKQRERERLEKRRVQNREEFSLRTLTGFRLDRLRELSSFL
jgi:hypothetical protein